MKLELLAVALMGVTFGAFCVYLGHNTVVIASVFTLLGAVGGYIVGEKKTSTK